MPGGDVSDRTLRQLRDMRAMNRRDRLAVAALVAGVFQSSQSALEAIEGLVAAPSPPAGRTRRDRHLSQLDGDVREWAAEIVPALAVLAAAERARGELESEAKAPVVGGPDLSQLDPAIRTYTRHFEGDR